MKKIIAFFLIFSLMVCMVPAMAVSSDTASANLPNNIYINGELFYSENSSCYGSVSGVSYCRSTNTLTLRNANLVNTEYSKVEGNGDLAHYAAVCADGDLKIRVVSDSYITDNGGDGAWYRHAIYTDGKLTITGLAELTITLNRVWSEGSYPIAVYSDDDLTLNTCKLSVIAPNVLRAEGPVSVNFSVISAEMPVTASDYSAEAIIYAKSAVILQHSSVKIDGNNQKVRYGIFARRGSFTSTASCVDIGDICTFQEGNLLESSERWNFPVAIYSRNNAKISTTTLDIADTNKGIMIHSGNLSLNNCCGTIKTSEEALWISNAFDLNNNNIGCIFISFGIFYKGGLQLSCVSPAKTQKSDSARAVYAINGIKLENAFLYHASGASVQHFESFSDTGYSGYTFAYINGTVVSDVKLVYSSYLFL